MKHILFFLLSICGFSTYAQTMKATIKAGGQNNSVIVAMRPSVNINNAMITTLYFSVAVPVNASTRPTATMKTNFIPTISYYFQDVPGVESIAGVDHWVYNFLGDGATSTGSERNYTAGVDNNVAEITFSGGSTNASEVKIVSLPDGGKTLNAYWNIFNLGKDITDEAAMFYGGTPVNSSDGYLGLSYTQIGGIILPVQFKSFFAVKSGDDAKLSWEVGSDLNNSHFKVLRSNDGRNFNSVQTVQALGNGQDHNNYQATDINLSKLGSRDIYYQIEQIDKDGTSTKSPVRMLSVDGLGKSVTAFPNPAKTTTKVVVDAPEAGKGTLIMRDALGRQVRVVNSQFIKGINQVEMNVMNLSSGDYNLQVNGAGLNETIKITKIN